MARPLCGRSRRRQLGRREWDLFQQLLEPVQTHVGLGVAIVVERNRVHAEPRGAGHIHANGGGWVANYATVAPSAYVGPNAMVLDFASVLGDARIEDYAIVMDSATVRDSAVVSGHAVVQGTSSVQGNARVRDRALIKNAVVKDHAVAEGYTIVESNVTLKDYAIARGCSWIQNVGDGFVGGYAIAGYDYLGSSGITDGVHFCNLPWGGWYHQYWWETLAKPAGLVASYRIEAADGQVCWDEFGAQHALLRGAPQRIEDTGVNSTVLDLNGTDQYVVLDRSICDLVQGSISLRIKPDDNTDRPMLYMGGSASKYLQLTLNSAGKAEFTITDGSTSATLTSVLSVPVGSWTSLTVTLDGSQCSLYVNGSLEDQASTSLVPVDVLGSNDYSQSEAYYIGRNWSGDLFDGRVDDIRFYNVAITQSQVANELRRSGDCIGAIFFAGEMDFDGVSTEVQSGVRNGLKRRLEAEIYPHTSDDVSYYEAILDSNDERSGRDGSGIGLDNGFFKICLDNSNGLWDTGVAVALNQWQHVALEFDGSTAKFFLNGQVVGTQSYSASAGNIAFKNYRIGFGMSGADSYYFFDGKIRNVAIYDRLPLLETDPPTPDPATWASSPTALSATEITMTATTGHDASGLVEYYFDEISGNAGGTDSGWQSSPIYVDSDLEPDTEYVYQVKLKDYYGNETQPCGPTAARTCYTGDFNCNGLVGIEDLMAIAGDWLAESEQVDPSLVALWGFDDESGVTVNDSVGGYHGTILGGASLDDSGALNFDGNNDHVDLPIGTLISTLTNSTFATWVDFSNSGGNWQRIFDFGSGTSTNMFLCPRTSSSGPMRFAIKALGGGEQQATATSTLVSGLHHVVVTLNDDNDTITLYLDGGVVATNTNATYRPSDMGVSSQNWLGRSQYGGDGYFNGSIHEFSIYDRCLSASDVSSLYVSDPVGHATRKTDLDANGIINLADFARFAQDWLQSN